MLNPFHRQHYAIGFAFGFTLAFAQNPLPQFEVATVKPPGPQDRIISLYNYPGGRVVISNYRFAQLLYEALGVQRFQILGAPAWIDSERFMIEAKPPAWSKLSVFTPSNRERRWSTNSARCCSGS